MDEYLDQFILPFPNPNTLAGLIDESVKSNAKKAWFKNGKTTITYQMADWLSNDIATFLITEKHHVNNVAFIEMNGSLNEYIVLLGAIKAGMVIIDPKTNATSIGNKPLLTFSNDKFEVSGVQTTYHNALKYGSEALFFNIPHVYEHHDAFIITGNDAGSDINVMSQKRAVKELCCSSAGEVWNSYSYVLHCWVKGLSVGPEVEAGDVV